MRQLHESAVVYPRKTGRHECYSVNEKLDFVDLDAIADIVRVFNKKEDARCEEIGHSAGKSEAQASESGEDGSCVCVEVVDEERS